MAHEYTVRAYGGNGGMQPTYGPRHDCTYLTEGGNKTLVNGEECEAIRATYEQMANVASDLKEDDSHVMGVYGESVFAGS